MIQRKDVLSIPFFKKSGFAGSYLGMRYRIAKVQREGQEQEELQAVVWEAPYSFGTTSSEKEYREFPFSEEGICQAVDWLNERWEQEQERWQAALENW